MLLNGLAIILFLGFSTAALIVFSSLDKQKEITVGSRYGRQTSTLEVVYVNIALLAVAFMLHIHMYRFLPALLVFVLLIFFNGRIQSGIAPQGVFIGTTFLDWEQIQEYRVVNDEISTIAVFVYANHKRYVLRCSKDYRKEVESYFLEHNIAIRDTNKHISEHS